MPAFLNDRFVENNEALLHVSDLSIQRGYAIFDFCRTMNGIPLFLQDHLDRFYASASAMHLPVKKNAEELSFIIHELIKKTAVSEVGIRITLTGGNSTDSYHPADPNLIITCNPVQTVTHADFEKGYSIITHEYQRDLPHVKSINYTMAVWLQPILKEKKADDFLYYNMESVTEFPRCNVFIVTRDQKLVTPAHNILKGITRKQVLLLATDMMTVEERSIPVDELSTASEIFLTATTKKIIPVLKLNKKIIGDGKPGVVTRKLYQEFLELENSLTHLVSL
jgi:D-alanine transaminase/branched-chain amino acid aminotransferase